MNRPTPINQGRKLGRKLSKYEQLAAQNKRLQQQVSQLALQQQKTAYQLDVAIQVLNIVVAEVTAESSVDFNARVIEIRSQIPLFAIRQQAASSERMIVNGQPKDIWFWDRAPGAISYRYRFITAPIRTQDGKTLPGRPLEWRVTTENMVENPDGYPSIQVFPNYDSVSAEELPESEKAAGETPGPRPVS